MHKFIQKINLSTFLLLSLITAPSANAQIDQDIWNDNTNNIFWNGQKEIANNIGLSDINPVIVITNIINIVLGFAGITMVIMFISAGFQLILANGNEDAKSKAQQTIWTTIVGAFIIFSSFGIIKFFIGTVVTATELP